MISRNCIYCNKEFKTYEAWLRKGKAGNFCSRKCSSKARISLVSKNVICAQANMKL